jgi:hypothetical protein
MLFLSSGLKLDVFGIQGVRGWFETGSSEGGILLLLEMVTLDLGDVEIINDLGHSEWQYGSKLH